MENYPKIYYDAVVKVAGVKDWAVGKLFGEEAGEYYKSLEGLGPNTQEFYANLSEATGSGGTPTSNELLETSRLAAKWGPKMRWVTGMWDKVKPYWPYLAAGGIGIPLLWNYMRRKKKKKRGMEVING